MAVTPLQLAWLGLSPEFAQARGDLSAYEEVDFLFVDATAVDWSSTAFTRQAERVAALAYLLPTMRVVVRTTSGAGEAAAALIGQAMHQVQEGAHPLAVVRNLSLAGRLDEVLAERKLCHDGTGEWLGEEVDRIVSAEAPLGPQPISDAWDAGARVVVAENISASTLAVAAAMGADPARRLTAALVAQLAAAGQILFAGLPLSSRRIAVELDSNVTLRWPAEVRLSSDLLRMVLLDSLETCPLTAFESGSIPEPPLIPLRLETFITPGGTPASWPLELILRGDVSLSGLLYAEHPVAIERLEDFLRNFPRVGSVAEFSWDLQRDEELDGQLLLISATDTDELKLQEFAAAVEHAVAATPGVSIVRPAGLAISFNWEAWPTSLPRSFVEPTLDLRPADEWRE